MRRKQTRAEVDLQMMKLRRENMVTFHKASQEESKIRSAIKAAENIKNIQNQYAVMLEANRRLPLGLQAEAMDKLRSFRALLDSYADRYPTSTTRPGAVRIDAINNVW